jgi:hypothetical protein
MSFAARTASGTASSGTLSAYLKDNFYAALATSPSAATVTFNAYASGSIDVFATVNSETYTWLIGGGVNSDYSIRLTVTSGTAPNLAGSALVSTWLPLGISYYWGLTTTSGNLNNQCTVEIAETALLTNILATGAISMSSTAGL